MPPAPAGNPFDVVPGSVLGLGVRYGPGRPREPRQRHSPTGAGGAPELTRGVKRGHVRWFAAPGGILAGHRPPWGITSTWFPELIWGWGARFGPGRLREPRRRHSPTGGRWHARIHQGMKRGARVVVFHPRAGRGPLYRSGSAASSSMYGLGDIRAETHAGQARPAGGRGWPGEAAQKDDHWSSYADRQMIQSGTRF